MKNSFLVICSLVVASAVPISLAETFNSVTISGSLNVNGTSNLNGNVNLGNQNSDTITSAGPFRTNADTRLGDAAADTTTIWGTLNLGSLTTILGSPDFSGSINVDGNITAGGANNSLSANQTLNSAHHIVTRGLGDDRYVKIGDALSPGAAASTYRSLADSYSKSVIYTQTEVNTLLGDYLLSAAASGTYRTILESYSKTEANAEFLNETEGDTRYVQPADLAPYRTIATSYSKTEADAEFLSQIEGDERYLSKAGPVVVGSSNAVTGTGTHAVGDHLTVDGAFQTLLGRYNVTGAYSSTNWIPTEPLFVIGNGTSIQPSNALTILKNGATSISGTLAASGNLTGSGVNNTLPNQTITGDDSILTKELADSLYSEGGNFLTDAAANLLYYPRTEADTTFISPSELSGSLTSYFTKSEANDRFFLLSSIGNYYTKSEADAEFLGQSEGDARYVQPAGLTSYRTVATSYSKEEADDRFLSLTGPLVLDDSNTVSGTRTHAIGSNLIVSGAYQTVLGRHNLTGTYSATDWIPTEPLFVIGNGSSVQPSNAITILKNGATSISGTFTSSGNLTGNGVNNTLPNQALTGDDSILTRELADERYLISGGAAYLTKTAADGYYLPLGTDFVSGAELNAALGFDSGSQNAEARFISGSELEDALADYTTTVGDARYVQPAALTGFLTEATADPLYLSQAEGDARYALLGSGGGGSISALHFAVGTSTAATGDNSVAMGTNTIAQGANQVVLGRYNVAQGDGTTWEDTDDLLIVGNGTADTHRSNAIVVKKNGDASFQSNVSISGETTITHIVPQGDILMGEFGN